MSKKTPGRKEREEYIYATTAKPVEELAVTVNSITGEVSFETDVKNVYAETSYKGTKGDKALNRIPQKKDAAHFTSDTKLFDEYDRIIAVDTNSKTIFGSKVSVVGIVIVWPAFLPLRSGPENYGYRFDIPLCIEYRELSAKPERFGWLAAIEELQARRLIIDRQTVGMIVDSELGSLNAINNRQQPVLSDAYIPEHITLMYGSSDSGGEYLVNQAIKYADSAAKQCFDHLESGSVEPPSEGSQTGVYRAKRIIKPNIVVG